MSVCALQPNGIALVALISLTATHTFKALDQHHPVRFLSILDQIGDENLQTRTLMHVEMRHALTGQWERREREDQRGGCIEVLFWIDEHLVKHDSYDLSVL